MPDPTELAQRLDEAACERRAIERLTAEHAGLDVTTAYATQWALVGRDLARGERLVGAKLGLTSAAKQRTMGVDEPLYGWLTSAMVLDASQPLPLPRWIHPRIEPEIAFLLGAPLRGRVSIPEVLAATRGVCAALEVIDSRYSDFKFTHPDVVADNASAAGFVLGPRLRPVDELEDLRLLGCVLRRDGEVVHTAAGAAVMGHPAAAVAWLSAQLGAVGRELEAGSVVLAGALTDAVPIESGTVITAELEQLGTIEVRS